MHLLRYIGIPLGEHPQECSCRNENGPSQPSTPARCPVELPFTEKVEESNGICPQRKLVYQRIRYVIGRVKSHDTRQESPSTKSACSERCDLRRPSSVDSLREVERAVGLS